MLKLDGLDKTKLDNIESNISNLLEIIGAKECTVNNVWRSKIKKKDKYENI